MKGRKKTREKAHAKEHARVRKICIVIQNRYCSCEQDENERVLHALRTFDRTYELLNHILDLIEIA